MVYKWLVVWVHIVALFTSRVHLANLNTRQQQLKQQQRVRVLYTTTPTTSTTQPQHSHQQSQTPILEETTPQHATKEGGKELHKFIKTLNNFVENLVVNNDKDYNIKKGDFYSDKHSDNDDIISNEIEKFHVNTLATPQDFYENGTSKRYRRENDGGVLGLNNGAWNDWDPVRKSKSSSFLVDVEGGGGKKGDSTDEYETDVDEEYVEEVENSQVDEEESSDSDSEDKKPPKLNVSDKNSPYALIDKYFPERESYFYQNKDNFLNNYNKGHKPDIGNLYPEEVWLVDESLLVLKGGSTKDNEIFEDVWEPLDDYEAPYREPVLPPPDFDPDTLEIGVGVPIDQVYKFNHQMIPRPDENPYEKTTTTTTTHSPLPPVPAVPTLSFSPAPASGLQRGYPNLALVRQNEIKTVLKEQEKHRVLPTPSPHKMRSPKVSRSRGPTKAPAPTPTTESEVKPKETPKVRVSSLSPHNPTPVPQLRSYQDTIWSTVSPVYKALLRSTAAPTPAPTTPYPQHLSSPHQGPFKHEVSIPTRPPPTALPPRQQPPTTLPPTAMVYSTTTSYNDDIDTINREIENIIQPFKNEVELGQDDYKAFIDEVSLFISKMENFHPERKSEQRQNGHDSVHLSGNHALQHTSGNHDEINRSGDPDRRQVWSVPVSQAEEGNYPGNAPNFGAEEPALQFPLNNNKQHHHSDTEQGLTSRVRDPLQSHIARQSIARQEQQQEQEAPVVTSSLPRRNINHIAEFRSFPSPSTPPPALKFEEEISPSTPPPSSPSFYSSTQSTEVSRDDRQTTLARSTTPSPPPATSTPVSSLPLRSQLVTSTPYISSPTTPGSLPSSPTPSPYNIVDGLGFDYADALEGFEAVKLKAGSHRGSIFGEGAKVISPIPEYDDRETATEPLIDRDHGISPFQRSVYPRSTTTPASWLPTPSSSPPSPPTPSPSPSPLPTTPSLSPIIATTFSALEYIEDNTIDNTIADSYREENDKFSKSLPDPIYSGFVPITPTSAPRFGSAAPVVANPYPTLYPSLYPTLTAPGIGEHFDENFVLRNHEFGTKLRNDNNNYPDPSENEILEGIDRKGKSYPPLVNTNSHHSAVNSLSPSPFQGRSRRPTPPPPPHPSIQRTTPPTPTHRRVSRPNNTLSRLISRRRGAVRRRRPVNNNNTNRQSKILRPRNPAPPPVPAAAQSIDRSSAGAVRYVSFFSGVTGGQTWGYSYNLGR